MRARLSLGELVATSGLFLEPTQMPDGWEDRVIAGAHVVEVADPTKWLLPNWVMLTTGLRIETSEDAQRELVRDLAAGGIGALAYGTFDDQVIPPAVCDEARKVGLPVLRVGEAVSFREIIRFVYEVTNSDIAHTFNRLSNLHRFVLDAFGDPAPAPKIVERLASFLTVNVLVFDGSGRTVLASHAVAERDVLFEQLGLHDAAGGTRSITANGLDAMAVPVPGADGQSYWLTIVKRGTFVSAELVRHSLQLVAPMLVATDRLGAAQRAEEEAARETLLLELIGDVRAEDADDLAVRAAGFGITFERPFRMVFADAADAGVVSAWRLGLQHELRRISAPHLVREHDGVALLVEVDASEVRAVLEASVEETPDLRVGVGRPASSVAEVTQSLRDAQLAVRPMVRQAQGGTTWYEDLDLPSLFVSEAKADRVEPVVDKLLGSLDSNPALLPTLVTYFEQDCDVRRAARHMHLHENTVRYRLARVERLMGSSLRSPATISALYLGLLAKEVTPLGHGD